MTVGCTMDIPADEYTAQWTAQTNDATTSPNWPWLLSSQCFLNEQYIVFTYTTYSLIQTTWLHSQNWIGEIEVDIWMQNIVYILPICMLIFHSLSFILILKILLIIIPHIFDTLLWYLHKLHRLKVVFMKVPYILCIGHLPDVPEMAKQCSASNYI